MSTRPIVVYWNNIPAPYMVERFNALVDRGDLVFEAWFNDRLEPDRSWIVDESSWRFPYRYLPITKIGKWKLHWPTPILNKKPDLLVSLYAEPSFLFGWFIARLLGVKTAFWCQVTFDSWVSRKIWKDTLKRLVFPYVDATLGSGKESQAFAMRYGVPEEKALCLRHSIDERFYTSEYEKLYKYRESIRKEIGVMGTVFIYVGRLWSGKGIFYLLEAFRIVQLSSKNMVSLILAGDGPQEQELRSYCVIHGISNVIFAGFHQKHQLPRYYIASDVFVFPTLGDPYGLVVDEAMACYLPIISTSSAGEINDRIEEGVNGYIVPPEDSEALAECMTKFVNTPELSKKMGKISKEKISGHTPEKWAEDFAKVVHLLIKK